MVRNPKKLCRSIRRAAVIHALAQCHGNAAAAAALTKESLAFVKRWQQRYAECKNLQEKPRSGRPRALSKQLVDTASTLLCEQQAVPVVRRILIAQHGAPSTVSRATVYRAVAATMAKSKPANEPFISKETRKARVAWGKQQKQARTDWSRVAALDSTYFTLRGGSPGGKVWHFKGHKPIRFKPNKNQQLHVYGLMSVHGKSSLYFVSGTTGLKKKYKRKNPRRGQSLLLSGVGSEEFCEKFEEGMLPEARQLFAAAGAGEPTFLLDNAPAHAKGGTPEFLAAKGVSVLPNWPPNSPDLNPIENAWGIIKPQVYRQEYYTLEQLKAAVLHAWAALPLSMLRNLMLSMPKRVDKVLRNRGAYIGY